MKLPRFNQKGITHILAPLAFIVVFAAVGSYVLLKSHADTLPTVVDTVSQQPPSLYGPGKYETIAGVGKIAHVLDANQYNPADVMMNDKVSADLDKAGKAFTGHESRTCVHARSNGGRITVEGYTSEYNRNLVTHVRLSSSTKFVEVCTPYRVFKTDDGHGAQYPDVWSNGAGAGIKDIYVEFAQ